MRRELDAAFALGVVAVVLVIAALWLFSCALHNPPPCTPGTYPDPCSYGISETVTDAALD